MSNNVSGVGVFNNFEPINRFSDDLVDTISTNENVSPTTEIIFDGIKPLVDDKIKSLKGRIKDYRKVTALPVVIGILHVAIIAAFVFGFIYGSTAIIITEAVLLSASILLAAFVIVPGLCHGFSEDIITLLVMGLLVTLLPFFEVLVLKKNFGWDNIPSCKKELREFNNIRKLLKGVEKGKICNLEALNKILDARNTSAEILEIIANMEGATSELLDKIVVHTKGYNNFKVLKSVYANNNYSIEKLNGVIDNRDTPTEVLKGIASRRNISKQLLLGIANHRNSTLEVLQVVYQRNIAVNDIDISRVLASHPNADAILRAIFQPVLETNRLNISPAIERYPNPNPNLNIEKLRDITQDALGREDTDLLRALALYPGADITILWPIANWALQGNHIDILSAIYQHDKTDYEMKQEILDATSFDEDAFLQPIINRNDVDRVILSNEKVKENSDLVYFANRARDLDMNSYSVAEGFWSKNGLDRLLMLPDDAKEVSDSDWSAKKLEYLENAKIQEFFKKLEESQDYRDREQDIKKRTVSIFNFIEKETDLEKKKLLWEILKDGGTTCRDRAVVALDNAEFKIKTYNLPDEDHLKTLCFMIINEHKKDLLKSFAMDFDKSGDPVEAYLKALIEYKDQHGIVTNIKKMFFDNYVKEYEKIKIEEFKAKAYAGDVFRALRWDPSMVGHMQDFLYKAAKKIEEEIDASVEKYNEVYGLEEDGESLYEKITTRKIVIDDDLKAFKRNYELNDSISMTSDEKVIEEVRTLELLKFLESIGIIKKLNLNI